MADVRGIQGLMLFFILAATACAGAGQPSAATPMPTQPLDPVAAQDWFVRGQVLANTTTQVYRQGQMSTDLATRQRDAAQALADDIRTASPSGELVLRIADDLDELVGALEFVLEFARNSGYSVGGVQFPSLEEALRDLAKDLISLDEELP